MAPAKWEVVVLETADRDIDEIVTYLGTYQSLERGNAVLNMLEEATQSLSSLAERGHFPHELEKQTQAFREIDAWPYRIIYEVDKETKQVFVHLIIDGRRNTAQIMEERLLRPPVWDYEE